LRLGRLNLILNYTLQSFSGDLYGTFINISSNPTPA